MSYRRARCLSSATEDNAHSLIVFPLSSPTVWTWLTPRLVMAHSLWLKTCACTEDKVNIAQWWRASLRSLLPDFCELSQWFACYALWSKCYWHNATGTCYWHMLLAHATGTMRVYIKWTMWSLRENYATAVFLGLTSVVNTSDGVKVKFILQFPCNLISTFTMLIGFQQMSILFVSRQAAAL